MICAMEMAMRSAYVQANALHSRPPSSASKSNREVVACPIVAQKHDADASAQTLSCSL